MSCHPSIVNPYSRHGNVYNIDIDGGRVRDLDHSILEATRLAQTVTHNFIMISDKMVVRKTCSAAAQLYLQ